MRKTVFFDFSIFPELSNYSLSGAYQIELLVYYSKAPTIGKCPIYNMWVFVDDTIFYREMFMSKGKKVLYRKLAPEDIGKLIILLESNLSYRKFFERIKDCPINLLRFDEKEFELPCFKYQCSIKTGQHQG